MNATAGQTLSPPQERKRIVFFPTVAHRQSNSTWRIPLHGWTFKPAEFSRLRRAALHLARRVFQWRVQGENPNGPLFKQRMGALLSDNQRNRKIQVELCGRTFTLKKSAASGHFEGSFDLSDEQLGKNPDSGAGRWLPFRASAPPSQKSPIPGRVLLLPPTGLSVISDIDDTIKITEMLDHRRRLHNTFLREFQCVPGMADTYRRWARAQQAAFHYVSASPWHLYPFLSDFLHAQGFPAGTFHLRNFRLMGADLSAALRSSRRVKSRPIQQLLEQFPQRRFILVGDSGEADAAMYAAFAERFGPQIRKVLIRNITGDPPASKRWTTTFARLKPAQWQVFCDPAEITQN